MAAIFRYAEKWVPNGTKWDVFEKAVPYLKKGKLWWKHDYWKAELTDIANDFNQRLLANGGDYSILPTCERIDNVFTPKKGFRTHHTQVKILMTWIDENVGRLPNVPRDGVDIDLDKTPGILVWWEDHHISKGGVRGSIHDRLDAVLGKQITYRSLTEEFARYTDPAVKRENVAKFLDDLQRAYADELNMPGIGLAFRKWFSDQGI